MARILVVDDDRQIVIALTRALTGLGHDLLVAETGESALIEVAQQRPDLVLLDDRLPDLSGLAVLERLRSWSTTPVLFVAGGASRQRRIEALNTGADDFVDKPFSLAELRARIDAALRRTTGVEAIPGGSATLVDGDIRIDVAARHVCADGQEVRLTPIEWRLLEVLLADPGAALSHAHLIAAVWSDEHGPEARASLRVHIRSLRRKLGDRTTEPRFIATVVGTGYRWVAASTT